MKIRQLLCVRENPEIFVSAILCSRDIYRNPWKICSVKRDIRGFKMIIDGEMDAYPESAFFNVGTIDDVIAKAKAEEAAE